MLEDPGSIDIPDTNGHFPIYIVLLQGKWQASAIGEMQARQGSRHHQVLVTANSASALRPGQPRLRICVVGGRC
jgi:hypothetical protein